jgi:threonylcarbamoyladenosine tRNA methylthiotransferase MtaB
LGCKLNYAETSTMKRMFAKAGCQLVDFSQPAEIYVVNTCSVTARAERKCREAVKKARKVSPSSRVALVGCYAELRPGQLKALEGVDYVLGINDKDRVVDILTETARGKSPSKPGGGKGFFPAWSAGGRTRSFLKVQDGCDYKCAYCTIPLARGRSRNAPVSQIVEQARLIAASGVQEIVLTGVNTGHFGQSTGESFIDLLQALEQVEGVGRYRISSIEPDLCTDELIGLVAGSGKFAPHFHLPLQSGSASTLKAMGRRYSTALFHGRVERIRAGIPWAGIGTDLIAAFPGETEADFADTLAFARAVDVNFMHVFTFSPRPGTRAATMPGHVPSEVAAYRSHALKELASEKEQGFYRRCAGQDEMLLPEKDLGNGWLEGFTGNYIRARIKAGPKDLNKLLPVHIKLPHIGWVEASKYQ